MQGVLLKHASQKAEGLRERKRQQTLQRISEVGMGLFLAKGYEATTLEEIAAAAGVSRRTLFYYFESKDDILLANVHGYADALKALVLENSTAGMPVDVVREALLKLVSRFEERQMLASARLMQQSAALRARNNRYVQLERSVYEGLCELWPKKERREGLRIVAMVATGALRVAVDSWFEEDGQRPLAKYIKDAFRNLKAEI
jgi:AcrR family transcriptional regulator